ncbi:MAG TPA: cytochrome c oxidase subunit II, partial [Steroidobacter sp.]|nr:cytochrome c oxidase subunit II [Steroidobacter sp.]
LLHEFGLALYVGATVIFIVVLSLAIHSALSPEKRVDVRHWAIGGGLVFPVVTLSALLVYSLSIGVALRPQAGRDALRIRVVGNQWWWEVRYESNERPPVVLANEVHIPVGRPVQLELATSDVIHSFWAPSLAGKVDMIPGRVNRLVIEANEPGVYRGQCAEYCGGQHAWMAFDVVVQSEREFRAWLAREARSARVAADPFLQWGREMFFRGKCQRCHRIRGSPANGVTGPDLTHVGSRRSLAAGTLRNHVGTMAGWIAGPQDVKPGNRMPDENLYTGQELRALAAWLESLE